MCTMLLIFILRLRSLKLNIIKMSEVNLFVSLCNALASASITQIILKYFLIGYIVKFNSNDLRYDRQTPENEILLHHHSVD